MMTSMMSMIFTICTKDYLKSKFKASEYVGKPKLEGGCYENKLVRVEEPSLDSELE